MASLQPATLNSNPQHQVINQKLVIFSNQKIGSGAFGIVFKGSYEDRPCAVKVLHEVAMEIQTDLPAGQGNETANTAFTLECEFLKSFRHPNVVQHLSTEKHPKSGGNILVTELMDCNLRSYLSGLGEKSLTSHCQVSLSRDIASGLAFIHSKGIIHRDLCGDNILLRTSQPVPLAKISDFGMSRLINPSQMSHTLTALGHRRGYLPPEALRLEDEEYDHSLDVFSLGVIMVQIVCKVETVSTEKKRLAYVLQIPATHKLKQTITNCLQENNTLRPSAIDIRDRLNRGLRGAMPLGMGIAVQSVAIGDVVYVGGGHADYYIVMKLDLQQNAWTKLPPYNAKYFAMTSLSNRLVLVGGFNRESTNQIATLEEGRWTSYYPRMNTARHSSTAICFDNHIVVAGGWQNSRRISSAEVLNVASKIWYNAEPLPTPRSELKSTLIGDTLYIMGGRCQAGSGRAKAVYKVDLNKLVSKAVRMQNTPTLWQEIEDIPLKHCAPLNVGGSLLAFGGRDDSGNSSTAIYLYNTNTRTWVRVGELPTSRYGCTCLVLPNSQIMVAGGVSHGNFLDTADYISL